MIAKEKVAAFTAEYNQQLNTLNDKVNETGQRLEEIKLEIRFIKEKEIPEAVQRRVLIGDKLEEKKIRKALEKLQHEHQEKSEDLLVLQNIITKFKQQKADEMQPLFRLFKEERNMIAKKAHERMMDAQKSYKDAISKQTEELHVYKKIEADLQQIEQDAGQRKYVETVFPIHSLKLAELSVEKTEITKITERI